jgi:hypothetical protein
MTELEKAAEKYVEDSTHELYELRKQCFIDGAEWQQEQAKETQKLTMINALVEFSIAHFDIHTEEAILNITRRAEKYYNETFKQQEQ